MQENEKKINVAVMFGGRSVEHEISIITALQAISAMNTLRYTIIPIYIHLSGEWFTGDLLLDKAIYKDFANHQTRLQKITLLPNPNLKGVIPISSKGALSLPNIIPIDVYFLAFHGNYGEDGCMQGLLELANAAYTGSKVAASAVAMNKYLCKMFLKAHEIPVLPATLIHRREAITNLTKLHQKIFTKPGLENYPLFIKPNHLGSSVGIASAHDLLSLNSALAKVFQYDDEAIIEPCIQSLMEINISVIDGTPPIASVVEIPVASSHILTYEDKYLRGGKSSKRAGGMASLTRKINPEDLDPKIKNRVTEYALKAYHLLNCSGVVRFDFMIDLTNGQLYFNEPNPIPGSLSYYLWEKSSPPLLYTLMIDRLIENALRKKSEQLALQCDFGMKALNGN